MSANTAQTRFDSGPVVTESTLPVIRIRIADNSFSCFNRVFDFSAGPR